MILTTIISTNILDGKLLDSCLKKQLVIIGDTFSKVITFIDDPNSVDDSNMFTAAIDLARSILDYLFFSLSKCKKFSLVQYNTIFISSFIEQLNHIIFYTNAKIWNRPIIFLSELQIDFNINGMKSKALQILSLMIQFENSTITNAKLLQVASDVVKESMEALNFIIENKFDLIKKINDTEGNYNYLIFNIFLMMCRFLIRDPIPQQFNKNVKTFALNTVLPFIHSRLYDVIEMKAEGEVYHHYISDLVQHFVFNLFF